MKNHSFFPMIAILFPVSVSLHVNFATYQISYKT